MPIRDRKKVDAKPDKNAKIIETAKRFKVVDAKVKLLSKELTELKDELKSIVSKRGYEAPNGSIRFDLDEKTELVNTLRSTAKLVPEAVDIIKKHCPEFNLIEEIEIVREDRLRVLIEKGKINKRLANRLYNITDVYAFGIKEIK